VPKGLLTGEHQNRATAEVVKSWFYENTVDPQAKYIGQEITRHFSKFEVGLLVEPLPYSGNDPDFLLKQLDQDIKLGLKTRNEIREARGEKPFDGGDIPLIPQGFVTIDQVLNPPTPPPAATPSTSTNDPSDDDHTLADNPDAGLDPHLEQAIKSAVQKAIAENRDPFGNESFALAYWKAVNETATSGEAPIRKAVVRFFRDREREILASLPNRNQKAQTSTGISFNVQEWTDSLTQLVEPGLRNLVKNSIQRAVNSVGLEWNQVRNDFDDHVRAGVAQSAARIVTIADTLKDELSQLLQDGHDLHPDELSGRIRNRFESYTTYGADRIARTTSTYATTNAQLQAWHGLGVVASWLTQRDGNARTTHKAADGQRPNEEGFFLIGADFMRHPCGGSIASENVNCRCVLRPRGAAQTDETGRPANPIRPPIEQPPPPKRPARPKKPKPSKPTPAPVTPPPTERDPLTAQYFNRNYKHSVFDNQRVNDFMQRHLPGKSIEDVLPITGAMDGSNITVTIKVVDDDFALALSVDHPLYKERSHRTLKITEDGLVLSNDLLKVIDSASQGIGTRIFASQVYASQQLGVHHIETYAAGQKGSVWNGYYTWPRLGYDAPIPSLKRQRLPKSLQEATRVSHLMASKKGQQWWKDNGSSIELEFDLSPNSYNSKYLAEYLKAKGITIPLMKNFQ
jgi:hypothetical protein